DSFLVQPTRFAARDMDVLVTDPAKVAAASPVITGNTAGNQGTGAISAATIDAAYPASPLASNLTLSYDSTTGNLAGFPAGSAIPMPPPNGGPAPHAAATAVPFVAGASYAFDGITVTMSGAPLNGDTFTINRNVAGVSDPGNALLLGALQRQTLVGGGTATFN